MTQLSELPAARGMRVAVVGVGRMGVRHIEAARGLGMAVCGIADVSADALHAARQRYCIKDEDCFNDAAKMLAKVAPDAVVIATTAPTHASFVMEAAGRGVRYLLCEKPMATSIADAEAMIGICDEAGMSMAVNHQMRFMPQYTAVKKLVSGDELGPLSSVLVAGSNFGLAMNASHYFEMFRFVTDHPVRSIQAWFDEETLPNPRGPKFIDRSGRLLAISEAGPSMFIDFSSTSGHGLQTTYIFRNGQVAVDELDGYLRMSLRKPEFRDLPTSRYGMPADVRTTSIEPADTVGPTAAVWAALLRGEDFPDGRVGLHALRCLVAAHVSSESNSASVRVDSGTLPRERVFPWA
jgi:predicted dehydrogenase